MEIVLIVAVVAGLALASVHGYRKGFVKIVLSMCALLVSVIATVILMVPASSIIKNTTKVYQTMEEQVDKLIKEEDISKLADIDKLNLPDNIKNAIEKEADNVVGNFAEHAKKVITDSVFNATLFLVLFIIIYIIVLVIINAVNLVTKLPVLNQVNKLAGLMVGLLYGILMLNIICTVLQMCTNMEWAKDVFAAINGNGFLNFIYNHNLLTKVLTYL